MAYLSTEYGVGDIVYAYCPDLDAVARLRVTSVIAESDNAGRYGGGEFRVSYMVSRASDASVSTVKMAQEELFVTPRKAFESAPLEAPVTIEAPLEAPVTIGAAA